MTVKLPKVFGKRGSHRREAGFVHRTNKGLTLILPGVYWGGGVRVSACSASFFGFSGDWVLGLMQGSNPGFLAYRVPS